MAIARPSEGRPRGLPGLGTWFACRCAGPPRPLGTPRPGEERRRRAGLLARGSSPVRVAFPDLAERGRQSSDL